MSSNVDVMPEKLAPLSLTLTSSDPNAVARNQDVYLTLSADRNVQVSTVYSGDIYWFPTLGQSRVKLRLRFDEAELKDATSVKIVTAETQVGTSNVLGAFKDAKECYYYTDTQGDKQSWQVNAVSLRPGGVIHYGDEVILTNQYFNQQLAPKGKWLTTVADTGLRWVIEKA